MRWLVRLAAIWNFAFRGHTGSTRPSVREWKCPCGVQHDFDLNAARNTLIIWAGMVVEEDYAAA
jgi:hypothetical protein